MVRERPPLQNRVTPFGEIVAVPDRGLFTGNRGIIHDAGTRTLLRRRWQTSRWLVCVCEFRGRRRVPMSAGTWTELFFLDEATALAAGHRPCFECRRADAQALAQAWQGGGPGRASADVIDRTLHEERLDGRAKRRHRIEGDWRELPDGAMIADGADSYLIVAGAPRRWTPGGYVDGDPSAAPSLLTPPSTLRALTNGYRLVLHATCGAS